MSDLAGNSEDRFSRDAAHILQGDSGGPLVTQNFDGKWELIGKHFL